jgi:pimeloyl-ACP methyl ester carboxylesterase
VTAHLHPGSTLVPSVGEGVPPSRTSIDALELRERVTTPHTAGSSFRRDAETNTRDACAPRILFLAALLLLAVFSSARATDPDTFSPVVSYQYLDTLAEADTTITSPVVSYQYFDWPGDENVTFKNSPNVSYFYDDRVVLPTPTGLAVSGQGLELSITWLWTGSAGNAASVQITVRTASGQLVTGYPVTIGAGLKGVALAGLLPGTAYRVSVRYLGAEGFRDAEAQFDFTTSGLPRNIASVTRQGLANEVGPRTANFTVTRSGAITQPLRVYFRLSGIAVNGVDYQPIGPSVLIPSGARAAKVPLVPILDTLPEGSEDVTLTLVPGPGYELPRAGASATAYIADAARVVYAVNTNWRDLTVPPASLSRWNFPLHYLTANDREQWYRIRVDAPVALNVTVTGGYYKADESYFDRSDGVPITTARRLNSLTGDVGLELYDARGKRLGLSDAPSFSANFITYHPPESLRRRPLPEAGYYYLRVYLSGDTANARNARIPYLVMISGGDDWDLVSGISPSSLRFEGEVHHVGFVKTPGAALAPAGAPRWVVTHGRDDHPGTFLKIAKALKVLEPSSDVVLLDWSTASDSILSGLGAGFWFGQVDSNQPLDSQLGIGPQLGVLLSSKNGQPRFAGEKISVVGHSWGTYVNHELAAALQAVTGQKVARMVAMDPAAKVDNYPYGSRHFSDHSTYSLGFWSSVFGNEDRTLTCTDAFNMEVSSSGSPLVRHRMAHIAFLTMLEVPEDAIGAQIRRVLIGGTSPIWARDPDKFDRRLHFRGNEINDSPLFSPDHGFEGTMSVDKIGGRDRAWEMYFHRAP